VTVAQRFGANLVRERKRGGLTQEDVSWRAGLHRTEISNLERGQRLARVDTLAKLAGALGVEPTQLLDGIDWRPGEAIPGCWEAPGWDARL
jgi:transcriptional regulator with XRE-family HTH domain